MQILFVDDDSGRFASFVKNARPEDTVYHAQRYTEAIIYFKYHFDAIFLDNDLGDPDGEGIDIVKFITSHGLFKETSFFIHSMNSICNKRMFDLLNDLGYSVERVPGVWKKGYKVV
jgi:hypothetical protein